MNEKKSLLPWFITRTLPEKEKQAVESWLQCESNAKTLHQETQALAQIIHDQEEKTPPVHVKARILAQIRKQPIQSKIVPNPWAWGTPLMLLIFIFLWLIVQPGTQLRWSISGNLPATFRIYRAPASNTSYKLLEEIVVNSEQYRFQFTDRAAVIPGQTYHYIIEAIDQNGSKSISPVIASNTMEVFAAQFALLLTSFILTFGMITIAEEIKPNRLSVFVVKTI